MTEDLEERLRATARREDRTDELVRTTATAASREGLVDVAVAVLDTPVGPVLAATTARGLAMLQYLRGGDVDGPLEELSRRISPRILELPERLSPVEHQLRAYFAGERRTFDLAVDWELAGGEFARRVLQATARIPYGQVRTYTDVAGEAGNPRATRATGNALGANPVPIVVPCHRVVRMGGGLGGYSGGLDVKRHLLALEGARPT